MEGTISKWKGMARRSLKGRLGTAMLVTIAVPLMNMLAGVIGASLFPGSDLLSIILGQVFSFTITLVMSVFSVGMCRMLLKMARREDYSYGDLLYYFRNQPDRVIWASILMAFISWLTSLPSLVYDYTASTPELPAQITDTASLQMAELFLQKQMIYLIINLGGLVLNMILTLPFAQTYYILVDDEEISGMDAVRESFRMMKGHFGKYILLQLSFLPWMLLFAVTYFLIMLWVVPYMEMTNVMFYRERRGEI